MSAGTHVVPIRVPGVGVVACELPELTCKLPDGLTGFYQRSERDCLRAALATVLQCPYEIVPEWPSVPGTWADEQNHHLELAEWVATEGKRLRFHERPPEGVDTFIAVDEPDENRMRHVFAVVAGHVFDPGSGLRLPAGYQRESPRRISHVLTLTPKGTPC